MLIRFFSLFFILLLLSSCARISQNPPPTIKPTVKSTVKSKIKLKVKPKEIVRNRRMPTFNHVEIEGTINVSLHTGYKSSRVILRGDPRDLAQVITEVKNNSLLVHVDKDYPLYGGISAEIRSRYLNSFAYKGAGTVIGSNLHSGLLDVSIDNSEQTTLGGSIVLRKLKVKGGGNIQISGVSSQYLQLSMANKTRVNLTGIMNLSKLDLEGDGWLSMYWIKSNMLTVCARGRTFIQLAGIVNQLDVELWDTAHFNGRYLRAQRAFVKTHNRAIADLTAIKHQHTLATDASDIYFYKIPDTKADFMAYEGSVLDMRDWDPYDPRDYDRYNK